MTTGENPNESPVPSGGEEGALPPSRREIVNRARAQKRRNRPFIIGGIVALVAILAIPAWAYWETFVRPPQQVAVQVNDVVYTRGDVVDYLRYEQRLAVEHGTEFNAGDSLFSALQTISYNELAYQRAPSLGVSVTEEEVNQRIRRNLGFEGLTAEEANQPDTRADIQEALAQFLNETQLSEEVYRDIVRKELFREEVRETLAADIPRVQPQIHLYALQLSRIRQDVIEEARRRLSGGESIESVAADLSEAEDAARTGGELGWFPRQVRPELDPLLFGTTEDGEYRLPTGRLSEPRWDGDRRMYFLYYIEERSDAREISDSSLNILSTLAFNRWADEQRKQVETYRVELNSKIFEWVNRQVRLDGIRPSPTAAPPGFGGGLPGAGQ
ncbi:MAG: peptidylprolyl isomerase [Chloroflexota bacterium]